MQRVLQAIETAITAHGEQLRKWGKTPYVVHPIRVMRKVLMYLETWPSSECYRDKQEIMLIVAALHDAPEDTAYTLDMVERDFGKEVRDGVWALTNPSKLFPELHRDLRKEMDRKHLAEVAGWIKVIKMWDRIDNLMDMQNGPIKFIMNVYLPESRALIPILEDADPKVAEQLRSAADWLEALTRGRLPKETA